MEKRGRGRFWGNHCRAQMLPRAQTPAPPLFRLVKKGKKTPMHASQDMSGSAEGRTGEKEGEGDTCPHRTPPTPPSPSPFPPSFSSCQFMKYAGQYPHLSHSSSSHSTHFGRRNKERWRSSLPPYPPFSATHSLLLFAPNSGEGGGEEGRTRAKWTLLSSPLSVLQCPMHLLPLGRWCGRGRRQWTCHPIQMAPYLIPPPPPLPRLLQERRRRRLLLRPAAAAAVACFFFPLFSLSSLLPSLRIEGRKGEKRKKGGILIRNRPRALEQRRHMLVRKGE